LPASVPLLAETKSPAARQDRLFAEQVDAARAELTELAERLASLRRDAETAFPLDEARSLELLSNLREHIRSVHAAGRGGATASVRRIERVGGGRAGGRSAIRQRPRPRTARARPGAV